MSFIQKAVVKGLLGGTVQIRNIFYAQVDPTANHTYQELWDTYLDAFYAPILTYLASIFTTQSVAIYQKSTEWILMDEVEFTKTGGDTTHDPLPNLLAAVVLGKIAVGRAFGRKFIAGFTEAATSGNVIESVTLSALASVAVAYITPVIESDGATLGPGIVVKNGDFHSFQLGVVSSLFGTMRRRKPGLGI